jgi:phosphoglycolate phosphatase
MPDLRAVLFDLDGTLIDTMQAFADVAAGVIARHHGIPHDTARAAYLATSGAPFFQQLEQIAPGDARNAAAVAEFEHDKLVATAGVEPDAQTVAALAALRAKGLRIAVCSNNFQAQVDAFVDACPAAIDLGLGFGGGLAKGALQFDRACERFGCSRDELLFCGDSIADYHLATAAGVRFVARLGTFAAADFARAAPDIRAVDHVADLLGGVL